MTLSTWWREPEELDDAQQRVVALPAEGRYLITGKPGSGKTNLLVLRAAYLTRSGHANVKVLTWGRLLSEFITAGSARHGLDKTCLMTFKQWAQDALREAGRDIEPTGDFAAQIAQLVESLGCSVNDQSLSRYDGILLDEVQDYPQAIVALIATLSERLFFVGDEKQRIYGADGTLQKLAAAADQIINLPFHYRNGMRICRVAEAIMDEHDYASTSRYPEERLPSRVTLDSHESLEEQVAHVTQELKSQLRSYPGDLLGVMVPLNDDLIKVVEILRESDIEEYCQFQTRAEGNTPLEAAKPIIVSTIHAAKGLEYRAAHIVSMEGIAAHPREKQRRIAYTAVTRAKTTLSGYHSVTLSPWLRAAFQRGQDPPTQPTLQDLF